MRTGELESCLLYTLRIFFKAYSSQKRLLFTTMSSLKKEEAALPAGTAPEPLNESVPDFHLHHCPRALPTVSHHHATPPSMPTQHFHQHMHRTVYEVRAPWEQNPCTGHSISHRGSHQPYRTTAHLLYIRPQKSSSCAISDNPWSGAGGESTPGLRNLGRKNEDRL